MVNIENARETMRIVNSINSASREAASDILKKYDSSQIENMEEIIDKIVDYYSNKIFMLGYWTLIKNNNNTGPSNEVVKNLAGEQLHESIFNIKKSIFIETYSKLLSGKEEERAQEELTKEIAEIMNFYLTRIFITGYMVIREENVEENDQEVRKHLNSIILESRDAASDIIKKCNSSQTENIIEVIDTAIDYYLNKMFMLGYWVGIKDNNNTDFGNEVVKNLAGKQYGKIFNIKKAICVTTYNKLLSVKEEERIKEELIEEIAERIDFQLKLIFITGCTAGLEENVENNDKNKALGISI